MELYPAGMLPAGLPTTLAKQEVHQLDVPALPLSADLPLSGDDVDFLESLLRECHLGDGAPAEPRHEAQQPAPAPPTGQPAGLPASPLQAPAAPPLSAPGAGQALPGAVASACADELLRQLQACASPEEARQRCAGLLTAFAGELQLGQASAAQQEQHAQEARMRKLQSANSVLLRGFRSLHQRQREAQARCQQAEEACARMAAELARCQEELRSSERAKSSLQYHLQLMSTSQDIVVGGI